MRKLSDTTILKHVRAAAALIDYRGTCPEFWIYSDSARGAHYRLVACIDELNRRQRDRRRGGERLEG